MDGQNGFGCSRKSHYKTTSRSDLHMRISAHSMVGSNLHPSHRNVLKTVDDASERLKTIRRQQRNSCNNYTDNIDLADRADYSESENLKSTDALLSTCVLPHQAQREVHNNLDIIIQNYVERNLSSFISNNEISVFKSAKIHRSGGYITLDVTVRVNMSPHPSSTQPTCQPIEIIEPVIDLYKVDLCSLRYVNTNGTDNVPSLLKNGVDSHLFHSRSLKYVSSFDLHQVHRDNTLLYEMQNDYDGLRYASAWSWTTTLCGDSTIYIEYSASLNFLHRERFPSDAHKGLHMYPTLVRVLTAVDVHWSNAPLVLVPTPDFSMPYNVLIVVSSSVLQSATL